MVNMLDEPLTASEAGNGLAVISVRGDKSYIARFERIHILALPWWLAESDESRT